MKNRSAFLSCFCILAVSGIGVSRVYGGTSGTASSPLPFPPAREAVPRHILLAAGGERAPEGDTDDVGERLSRVEQAMVSRDASFLSVLREWAARDRDERVRERSVGALTLIRDAGSSDIFLRSLSRDPSPRVRRAAAEAIGILGLSGLTAKLTEVLEKDEDPYVRAECARALGRIKSQKGGIPLMVSLVNDPSPEVRALCAEALSGLRLPESYELLRAAAQQDPSTLVRIYAVRTLTVIDPAGSAGTFRSVWEGSSDPELRVAAFRGLLLSGRSAEWENAGLSDFDDRVRFLAFRSWLSRSVPPRPGGAIPRHSETVARLEGFLKDSVQGIRELAKESLEMHGFAIRPDGFGYAIER